MAFYSDPKVYIKTALSDLQETWSNLRESVISRHPFPDSDILLLHIDEGMSWESVRNLPMMKNALLLISNTAQHSGASEDVLELIDMVRENLDEVLAAIKEGEIK